MGGRSILVVSSGLVHPSAAARLAFAAAVRRSAAARLELRSSIRSFRSLDPDRHAAVAAFFFLKSIEEPDLAALEAFVDAGGGLFALHGALASFKHEPRWAALLGAGFAGHGHPALLAAGPSADPGPFEGIPAFAVTDEPYRIRPAGRIVVRFSAIPAGGGSAAAPILWTREHGRGRICCCALGHSAPALRLAAVQSLIARALAWVSAPGEGSHGA